jgi:hypothetical protein
MLKWYSALFRLRWKQAVTYMPRAAAGTALFLVLLALGTFGIQKINQAAGATDESLSIAVCIYEQEGVTDVAMPSVGDIDGTDYIRMAFDYVGGLDAVRQAAKFTYDDDETAALKRLKNGDYAAVVVIPKDFIRLLTEGNGSPARIIFAGSGTNVSSALFQELIRAGADDVSAAQLGVYAVDDAVRALAYGALELSTAEWELSTQYFSYALDRNAYFTTEYVSQGRVLTLTQSFVCMGIAVVMALGGILCIQCLCPDTREFAEVLRQKRIPAAVSFIAKVLAASLASALIYGVIYVFVCLSAMRFSGVAQIMTAVDGFGSYTSEGLAASFINILKGLGCMTAAVALNYTIAAIVYALSGNRAGSGNDAFTGIMILVILYLFMFLAAGLLIAPSQLPHWLTSLGNALPARWIYELVKVMVVG